MTWAGSLATSVLQTIPRTSVDEITMLHKLRSYAAKPSGAKAAYNSVFIFSASTFAPVTQLLVDGKRATPSVSWEWLVLADLRCSVCRQVQPFPFIRLPIQYRKKSISAVPLSQLYSTQLASSSKFLLPDTKQCSRLYNKCQTLIHINRPRTRFPATATRTRFVPGKVTPSNTS